MNKSTQKHNLANSKVRNYTQKKFTTALGHQYNIAQVLKYTSTYIYKSAAKPTSHSQIHQTNSKVQLISQNGWSDKVKDKG